MFMRTVRMSVLVFVVAISTWIVGRAWGIGFALGATKDQLKLNYDVTVTDHSSGRVTIVFTLADEGRLKPLEEVQFVIPGEEKNEDGGHWMDLVVSINMTKTHDGKRVGRVHILKELAKRGQIWLNTNTMDGKLDVTTRLHHVIPIANYLEKSPAAAASSAPSTKQQKD